MMNIRSIPADDLKVGDTLVFLGTPHVIMGIVPYDGTLKEHFFGRAIAVDTFSISLPINGDVEICARPDDVLITCATVACGATFYRVPARRHPDLCLDCADNVSRAVDGWTPENSR